MTDEPGGRMRGRRLSGEEAELWARVARTVTPLDRRARLRAVPAAVPTPVPAVVLDPPPKRVKAKRIIGRVPPPPPPPVPAPMPRALDRHGLDGGWDKRLAKGLVAPDFTLDLHGATLDMAHARLDSGLLLACAQGARLVLLVTGRARPQAAADRGNQRGAIRAKFLDWLEAGPHASRIAAIRPAHPRHGGAGAVYIVLRRGR
jgi:DNA-nicking Smr family endonuclease